MATATLSELRTRVRFLGTYENSAKFTDALVNGEINVALAELYEVMDDACQGFFDTTGTLTTTANQDYVDLPADLWRLRGVDRLDSGRYIELRQVGIFERNDFQSSASTPIAYRTATGGTRGRLILYPTPSSAMTLRVVYVPTLTKLVADGDSFEFYNGNEDYVVCRTLLSLDQREERALGERQQELARIRDRIVRSLARRRSAEPQYLRLNGWDIDDLDYL